VTKQPDWLKAHFMYLERCGLTAGQIERLKKLTEYAEP